MIHELGLSLSVLSLEVRRDQEIPLEGQEDLSVHDLLKLPLSTKGAKGGSTRGSKSKRNNESQTDNGSGGLQKAQLGIQAGIKLSKEITEDIIWDSLASEYHQFYFSIGIRKKQELYVISQSIRCKTGLLKPDTKRITKVYLRASIPELRDRASLLLRNRGRGMRGHWISNAGFSN